MLESWLLAATLSAAVAPRIEVYTMGPGEHLFERFGHAAICVVYDDRPAKSRCYNYGTTDFGSPPAELGWEFLRGTARFWVSVASPERMARQYTRHDRTLFRQRLGLSPDEVYRIEERLARDARPENRYYLYHHFDDNCSTRVRDIIEEATGRFAPARAERVAHSYRELGKRALAGEKWAAVVSDLLVGRRADARPSRYDAMFLPDFLRTELTRSFGAQPEAVYRRRGATLGGDAPASLPWWLLAVLAVALPAAAGRHFDRQRLGFGVSGVLLGLVGALVWIVALLSRVPELVFNEQLLIFAPFDALLALLRDRARAFYARLRLAELVLVSAGAALGLLWQPLLAAVLAPGLVCLLVVLTPSSDRAPRMGP